MTTSNELIRLDNVVKIYDSGEVPFTALNGIDLTVRAGEFVGLIGKSGSGKTTLINMITGIDRLTSGAIYVAGERIDQMNENRLAVFRGKTIGVVFQFFQLLPTLTVAENIMLPMDFCNMYRPAQRLARARELLAEVELESQADKLPASLSGGQQQRVAIARALANDPPLIVADEPTGNLDSKTAVAVFNMFERLIDKGKTILMVTHDNDLAARVRRELHVADGAITGELRRDPVTAFGRIGESSVQNGTDKMTMEEIDAEIAASREERKTHGANNTPNAATLEAIRETENMKSGRFPKKPQSVASLFEELKINVDR